MREHRSGSALVASTSAFLAGSGITWAALGDLSESGTQLNDKPIFELPNGTGAVQVVVLLAGGVAAAITVGVFRSIGERRSRLRCVQLAPALALFGAFLGFSVRVLGSRTEGANIGGGGLLLILPLVTLGMAAHCVVVIRRSAHEEVARPVTTDRHDGGAG